MWEFALDEEGEEGQDEATVRPWTADGPLDPDAGMFVVRATFVLADGSQLVGFVTPPFRGDSSLGTLQPSVVTDAGQVSFWYGAMGVSQEIVADSYAILDRSASDVFPLRFSSDPPLLGGPVTGQVTGFQYYRSVSDNTVVEVR